MSTSSKAAYSFTFADLLAWCICNAVIALATIVGNMLILGTFMWLKKLRKKRNIFVACLACADVLVGLLSIPFWIATLVSLWLESMVWVNSWLYDTFIILDVFSGLASVFHLLLITVERLYAIAWPVQHRIASRRSYILSSAVAWLLALVTSILFRLPQVNDTANTRFLALLICYLAPLLSICVCYTAIWIIVKLKNHAANRSSRKELKLVGTIFVVVILFVLAWIPFVALNAIVVLCSHCRVSNNAVYSTKLLHYTNSALNPLVYALRLPDFRNAITLLLCQRKGRTWRQGATVYGRATSFEVRTLADSRRCSRMTNC